MITPETGQAYDPIFKTLSISNPRFYDTSTT